MRTVPPALSFGAKIHWPAALPYVAVHLMCLCVVAVGARPVDVAVCAGLYTVRMWGLSAGYHRYFSHRAFQTGRVFQFLLALVGTTTMQKGVLLWAAHHRNHHRYSDEVEDVHSPVLRGFWWSHSGWICTDQYIRTNHAAVKDLSRFPELVWLNRFHCVPGLVMAGGLYLVGGFSMLVWGFFVSTTLTYNGLFALNSFCHVFGTRRYKTADTSRNFWLVALFTLGDGWHNNHHHHQNTASHGWFWWEVDFTYYSLKVLSWLGVVWELRMPSDSVKYAHLKYSPEVRAELAAPMDFWAEAKARREAVLEHGRETGAPPETAPATTEAA